MRLCKNDYMVYVAWQKWLPCPYKVTTLKIIFSGTNGSVIQWALQGSQDFTYIWHKIKFNYQKQLNFSDLGMKGHDWPLTFQPP